MLTRKTGAPFAFERDIEGCEILPSRFETSLALSNRTALGSEQLAQHAELRELARRFLLIDVPAAYC